MNWPVLDREPVALPELSVLDTGLWDTMVTLASEMPGLWTLIGGQMVLLHALEHDVNPTRVSTDLDALVNFRASVQALPRVVAALERLGFRSDGVSPDNVCHRYRRGGLTVDVLAPEGLGSRADLRTSPPSTVRTVQVPGGTQALRRTELVPVTTGERQGLIPRPSLIGAIVGKALAVDIDDLPEAQRQDLVLLLSLVDDPFVARDQLDRKDLQRLRVRRELLDRSHRAWRTLDDHAADRGHTALRILTSSGPRTS